jgi:hypothetical protein
MAGAGFLVGTAKPTGVAESDISGCNWRWKERKARTSEEDEVELPRILKFTHSLPKPKPKPNPIRCREEPITWMFWRRVCGLGGKQKKKKKKHLSHTEQL